MARKEAEVCDPLESRVPSLGQGDLSRRPQLCSVFQVPRFGSCSARWGGLVRHRCLRLISVPVTPIKLTGSPSWT